jgi:hypothetical protein
LSHRATEDTENGTKVSEVCSGSDGRTITRSLALTLFVLCALCASVAKKAGAQAAREVVATKGGWRPPVVQLALKSEDDERCFAIDALRIEKRIVPGKVTSLEFTPDRAGNFPFYDCLDPDGKKGRLAVTE